MPRPQNDLSRGVVWVSLIVFVALDVSNFVSKGIFRHIRDDIGGG